MALVDFNVDDVTKHSSSTHRNTTKTALAGRMLCSIEAHVVLTHKPTILNMLGREAHIRSRL